MVFGVDDAIIAAGIGAGGSILGGLFGSHGAKSAANAQTRSANQATALQKMMWERGLRDTAPYRATGARSLGAIESILMGIPYNQTAADPYVERYAGFGNPGALERGAGAYGMLERGGGAQLDENGMINVTPGQGGALSLYGRGKGPNFSPFFASPDYQFRMQEGVSALDRSAAARRMLMSGAQMKALTRFGQGTAAGGYDSYMNRLSALAGIGGTASNNMASNAITAGQGIGQTIQDAGAARASGYAGSANAWGGAMSNGINTAASLYGMFGGGSGGGLTIPNGNVAPWTGNAWAPQTTGF